MRHWKCGIQFFTAAFALLFAAVFAQDVRAMSGTGTEADPYIITSAAELQAMRNDLTGHYALGADIDMAGFSWTPVGNALDGPFNGSLDGRGRTISNLSINLSDMKFVGLFGYMEGSVHDVTLSEVTIIGGRYVGGIAGNAGVGSSIANCHVLSGGISTEKGTYSAYASVGGVVGLYESDNIQGCSNGAQVGTSSDYLYAGGVIGCCAYDMVSVRNCTNSGPVEGTYSGGIIGYAELPVLVDGCDNLKSSNGQIKGRYSGGIIGKAGSTSQLSNCTNAGKIYCPYIRSITTIAGGIVGISNGKSTVTNCTNTAYVYGDGYSAGIIGSASQALLTGCINSGEIDGGGTSSSWGTAVDYYVRAGLLITSSSSSALNSCENRGQLKGSTGGRYKGYSLASLGTISGDSKSIIVSLYSYDSVLSLLPGKTTSCSINTDPSSNYLDNIVWTSSDESVATVDENGNVTGHGYGTATITATTTGLGLTSTYTVHVAPAMALDPAELTLEKGLTAQLTPVRTPEIDDTYTWSSSSSSYVSVDNNGVITAKASGTATITATSVNSGVEATCTVHVIDPIVQAQSVKVSQAILRPVPGERIQLSAAVSPSSTTDKSVTWASSDPAIATVSASGVVEAVAPGEATVTVSTANGLYDTCQVKVVQLSSAAFVIPNSRGTLGETFDTAVHLVKNPGIAAFTLEVQYDAAALTPTAVTPGSLLASGTLTSNVGEAADGKLRVTWYSDADAVGDGPAFTITWQTAEQTGSFPISLHYDQADICNAEKVEVHVNTEDGISYILDRPVGDIYSDGLVNMKDIVYFSRYFNEQETLDSSQRLAADLFYDGNIDVKDLTELAQVLSKELPDAAVVAPFRMNRTSESLAFTISDAIMEEGVDIVTMDVSGNGQSAALRFRVAPPDGMHVLSVQPSSLLAEKGTFAYNSETGIVTWYSNIDQLLDGELFTITLDYADGTSFPAQVGLEYSGEDFFSTGTYANISVSVQGGTISQPPFAEIKAAKVSEDNIAVTIDTNRTEPALLIVAFYQDERMTAIVTTNVYAAGEYKLDVPVGVAERQCKVFLLDREGLQPLSPSREAVQG